MIIRDTNEQKLQIRALTNSGKYTCISDFIRGRIFRKLDKKVEILDDETNQQLKVLDYDLNKIGVNFNQLSKHMNSHAGYNTDDNDRRQLKESFKMTTTCLAFLQKYLR